ncbi:MAG: xanthine dehydrogenase molybdenum-binding subunit XdhA [Clostridia bacterium]|nr:xanthine dehydrogenase molybdenum-binding subunit XdhA [Clostridia bacterium]
MQNVGRNAPRVDAYEKVTGRAKYTDDYFDRPALVAKVCHSTIANGVVKSIDISKAAEVPGVVKIVTCFDVPEIDFPTAGHPWSTDVKHQDIADRRLLNRRVRYYGDDIAAVVAEDEVAAARAIRLMKVEYEEFKPLLTPEDAMSKDAMPVHDIRPDNIIASTDFNIGDYDEAISQPGIVSAKGTFDIMAVKHCHMENPTSYAYMESGRIVVVSGTQIPHIMRRVIGQALGVKWGRIRVIKPYLGGGFGNKQDVLYEPLNAYLTTLVGGRLVKLEIGREESFMTTRTRHAMKIDVECHSMRDGTLVANSIDLLADNGAYASHGHSVAANGLTGIRLMYRPRLASKGKATTVYTNKQAAGAMRGYGIPQMNFAVESVMDDLAAKIGMDPVEFRRKNMVRPLDHDPFLKPIAANTCGLEQCLDAGMEHIGWKEKRVAYANQTGLVRRGVGMALFAYKTGIYPISLETATCFMSLNQDGSINVSIGATEIGQGADTVFSQMAADALGVSMDDINLISTQDTDITPYDSGAYASRQTYVSGKAVVKTAKALKKEILDYASAMLEREAGSLDIINGTIFDAQTGEALTGLDEVATQAMYSLTNSRHLSAVCTSHCDTNAISFGVAFADIEVDMRLGKIEVKDIINVHDSGKLINPQLAAMQVHGGMGMAIGMALSEKLIYDGKTGKLLNGNLLDYKMPTALDLPDLNAGFVETFDPTGPFGNKSLGEPPNIPGLAAIRNALLNATGIAFYQLPLDPQTLIARFKAEGLI